MKGLIGATKLFTARWAIRIIDGAIDLQIVVSFAGIRITLGGAMAVSKQSLKV